jgi:hypothetical protein
MIKSLINIEIPAVRKITGIIMLCIVLFVFAVSLSAQQPMKASNWDSWQFLLGEWVGEGGGSGPGQGLGTSTFYLDLQDTILVRKNQANYPASKDRPAYSHDDLMIIYQQPDSTKAIYFDNEGHVIHYTVELSPGHETLTFLSEIIKTAPRFRLTYTKVKEGTLKIKFEIAPPGKPEAFSQYIEAVLHRKQR